MKHILFTLSIFLFTFVNAQSRLQMAELNMQETLGELIQHTNNKSGSNEDLKQDIRKLFSTTDELYNVIREDTSWNDSYDTAYIQTLEESQMKLQKFLLGDASDSDLQFLINSIQKDYDTKIKSSSLALNSNVRRKIKVKVITTKDGASVNGYYIRGNQLWDFELEEPKIIFNNPTNNAEKYLPPGRYILWAEKDGKKMNTTQFEVGDTTEDQETLIILL